MTRFDDIKSEISKLSADELARLKDWLTELEAQRFDEQIERDATAGKLDRLMAEAKANHAAGRRQKL